MKNWQQKLGYGFLIILLAIYPVYTSLVSGYAEGQFTRQTAFIRGESDFFNPWQYRILAPYLIEGIAAIFKPFFDTPQQEQELYFAIFKFTRFLQHLFIFGLALKFYRLFTGNRILLFLAVTALAASMGAATMHSDFSFHNYFDVIFYLLAVLIIFRHKNILWLFPLTFLAALNRETSLLIPFLLFINYRQFLSHETRKKYLLVFAGSIFIISAVLILIRLHYGYQPPAPIGMETGWPILRFNLTDPVTLLKLFATLSILPLLAIFNIRKTDSKLQILFWLLVPAWFGIHFCLVWARETRLFLVPLAIVLIPIVLDLVQKSFQNQEMKIKDFKDTI